MGRGLGFFVVISAALSACGGHVYHVVERGETLYSIGWLYGYDYRQVAAWNGIAPPYALEPGQHLRVIPPDDAHPDLPTAEPAPRNTVVPRKAEPVNVEERSIERPPGAQAVPIQRPAPGKAPAIALAAPLPAGVAQWRWPTKEGAVVQPFVAADPGKRGVDIVARAGTPIFAAATGRVVYSGGGLTRYGQLIILKHDEVFLSAYAHNDKLLVKEGDIVTAGQMIAEMGATGTNNVHLHFEIRKNGKPVDPTQYLPRRD